MPRSELIISTYNNPVSLALCLESVAVQRRQCDRICIADDGSDARTRAVLDAFSKSYPNLVLRHVWHEDRGFQKCAILNKAIVSSSAEFLVFLDGDVLIHPDFIARHFELARPGRFASGSLIRLDEQATAAVTPQIIHDQQVFSREWLRQNRAIDRLGTWLKTMPFPKPVMAVLDRLSPVKRVLCGANWSAFRADILRVNGFDEDIAYGGLDKELGTRLTNAGIPGRHLRFTAPLIHLDHPRSYADPAKMRRHKAQIRAIRKSGKSWAANGIQKEQVT